MEAFLDFHFPKAPPPQPHHCAGPPTGPTVPPGRLLQRSGMCLTASLEPRADLQGWGVAASIQAFCLLLGTCCVLGTALSTGKGMNKTGAVPVLRELTPQGRPTTNR